MSDDTFMWFLLLIGIIIMGSVPFLYFLMFLEHWGVLPPCAAPRRTNE
ncbi:hypothetical protein LCGC14_0665260 [marine sediment metagenome]|uniref:Uncharacterized protein n=1 Tax=marine sediment metagenome TaxID=412755 RepID=A0A0F9QSC0_9ZZZZ